MNHNSSISEHPVVQDPKDFDRNSGSWAERLLFNHRWLVMLMCLVVTLVLGYQAFGLKMNASFERMIPGKHPFVVNYQKHKTDLSGLGNTLRIAVTAPKDTVFEAGYMDTLRRLNDELFLLPGVDRSFMKSLWMPATRWMGVTEEGLEGGPVIPDD